MPGQRALGTFVSVGNSHQPFSRLVAAVLRHVRVLPAPVLIQSGYTTVYPSAGVETVGFLRKQEFSAALEHATVVITHGGAGSIIDARAAGKVPVVMPRLAAFGEIIDDHQLAYVRRLDAAEMLVLCEDDAGLPSAVARALTLQTRSGTSEHRRASLLKAVSDALREIDSRKKRTR